MAEYFSHDYGARNDPKLLNLQMKMGQEGKGIFWDLIEVIYEQGGYIMRSECEGIAYSLRISTDALMRVLTEFDLFKNDGEKYYSESVLVRLNKRHERSVKASESAKKRWGDANALRTQSKGNAKKERKGKERKGKESIKREDLTHPLQIYIFDNCPEVSKLEHQLTHTDSEELSRLFSSEVIKQTLEQMENKPGFAKKYKKVGTTLRNWIQVSQNSKFQSPPKKQTLDDLRRYKENT